MPFVVASNLHAQDTVPEAHVFPSGVLIGEEGQDISDSLVMDQNASGFLFRQGESEGTYWHSVASAVADLFEGRPRLACQVETTGPGPDATSNIMLKYYVRTVKVHPAAPQVQIPLSVKSVCEGNAYHAGTPDGADWNPNDASALASLAFGETVYSESTTIDSERGGSDRFERSYSAIHQVMAGNIVTVLMQIETRSQQYGGAQVFMDPTIQISPDFWLEVDGELLRGSEVYQLLFSEGFDPGPQVDSDGDGLPDDWEELYGFSTTNSATPGLDADGDRMSNLDEFIAKTNPTNALSFLAIEQVNVADEQGVSLRWPSNRGCVYRVAKSTDLTNWNYVSSYMFTTSGVCAYTNAVDTGAAFFRVHVSR